MSKWLTKLPTRKGYYLCQHLDIVRKKTTFEVRYFSKEDLLFLQKVEQDYKGWKYLKFEPYKQD